MPITPRFTLSQDDPHVTITIKIPYVRPSSAEIHVAGTDFSFYCKPYLLKLAFPHTVIDTSDGDACANNIDAVNNGSVSTHNGSSSNAEYDPNIDNGTLTIKLVKEEYGQFFEDLDLLTTLLVQQKDIGLPLSVMNSIGVNNDDTGKKMISVIDDDSSTEEQVGYCGEDTHNMGATDNLMSLLRPKYGFLQQHCNVFRDLREELRHEMIDLPDPDDTDQFSMRRSMRLMQELEGFDEDRYLGDYFGASEDMLYLEAKHMDVHWHSTHATSGQSIRSSNDISESQEIKEMTEAMHKLSTTTTNGFENCNQFFTQDERDLLLRLSNRDYGAIIAGASDETNLFLGLIDILYAYAYDYRMTIGDPSSESAWYRPKRITLFVADLAVSCVAAPIVEELVKLKVVQWYGRLPRNYYSSAASSSSSSVTTTATTAAAVGGGAGGGGEGEVTDINTHITTMLACSLGLKLADSTRRICMYTKRHHEHKAFYAICRGAFPIQELCGCMTALQLARRDILGVQVATWRMILGAVLVHAMANFRGMKPVYKWNAATPWSEVQLSPWWGGEDSSTPVQMAHRGLAKLMWLILLGRVFGYCVKNYYRIGRQARKRATTYAAGRRAAFLSQLAADDVLKRSKKDASNRH